MRIKRSSLFKQNKYLNGTFKISNLSVLILIKSLIIMKIIQRFHYLF